MSLAETWTAIKAHWLYAVSALFLILLFVGGWIYGNAQYNRGRDLARADIADSISVVYEARYTAFRDSTQAQIAAFQAGLTAATDRAIAAEAQAASARAAAAAVLTPTVIAQTPPQVLALVVRQNAVIDTLVASNKELVAKIHRADSLLTEAHATIQLADTTMAHQRETITDLQDAKSPPHGFWHTAGTVAKFTSAVATGILTGLAIAH